MIKKPFWYFPVLFSLLFLAGCYRVPDQIDPQLSMIVQENYIHGLKSAFEPLNEEEKKTEWAKEFIIAQGFAKEFDLYRAISNFKRAQFLIGPENAQRKLEIQYDILLCYYLGGKYLELIETFEMSDLPNVDQTFATFSDLLVILYECYRGLGDEVKSDRILNLLKDSYPHKGQTLEVSMALMQGDIPEIQKWRQEKPELAYLTQHYFHEKKSPPKAQILNALLPGAGYFYIGQKRSAVTSFFLNTLFTYAAYQFFHKGYIAAGIVTTSFEMGWYFGGIYGAGQGAKYYNEKLYEANTSEIMNKKKLYPIFTIEHAF